MIALGLDVVDASQSVPVPVTANKRGAMPPKRDARGGANDSTTSSDIDATNAIDAIGEMRRMLWATNCSAVTFAQQTQEAMAMAHGLPTTKT